MTFLAPAKDRDSQINGIRRWEQAFRIYAAIYCSANPTRSGEIWQYIHTINSAASTYQWDSVQYYDSVFRQMMAERPGRSWSKTYYQLWQLALKDHLPKNNQGGNSFATGNHASTSGMGQNSTIIMVRINTKIGETAAAGGTIGLGNVEKIIVPLIKGVPIVVCGIVME